MLGEGWWSGLLSFGSIWNHFGDRQSLLAKLVDHLQGRHVRHGHDQRPRRGSTSASGPIVYSSLDFGEVYDAVAGSGGRRLDHGRLQRHARGSPPSSVPLEGTTFSGSEAAGAGRAGHAVHVRQAVADRPDRQQRRRVPHADREERQGSAAQRVSSTTWARTSSACRGSRSPTGARAATITLRFSEMLYPDLKESGKNVGMIMTENYRAALSQDVYTMKAGRAGRSSRASRRTGSSTSRSPASTSRCRWPPSRAWRSVRSASLTADYKTSSEKVNRLWSNLVWSNVDNFLTIPTDCPQRNERMGWSGDINVFSRTATYVSNANQFLTRHMYAMRDVQAPTGRFTDVAPGRRRLRRRALGQRRHRRAVGDLPAVQGRRPARAALPGDGRLHGLPRDDDRSEDGPELGRPAGRLARAAEQRARAARSW